MSLLMILCFTVFAGGISLYILVRKSAKANEALEEQKTTQLDKLHELKSGSKLTCRGEKFAVQGTIKLNDEDAVVLHQLRSANGKNYWLRIEAKWGVEFWQEVNFKEAAPPFNNPPMEFAVEKRVFVLSLEKSVSYSVKGSNAQGVFHQLEYTSREHPEEVLVFAQFDENPRSVYHSLKLQLMELEL